jgi:hypothetical protein
LHRRLLDGSVAERELSLSVSLDPGIWRFKAAQDDSCGADFFCYSPVRVPVTLIASVAALTMSGGNA